MMDRPPKRNNLTQNIGNAPQRESASGSSEAETTILRSFLLDTLPEGDRECIEERILREKGFLAEVEAVEQELLDDYARGLLTSSDAERVVLVYGSSRVRAQRARISGMMCQAWRSSVPFPVPIGAKHERVAGELPTPGHEPPESVVKKRLTKFKGRLTHIVERWKADSRPVGAIDPVCALSDGEVRQYGSAVLGVVRDWRDATLIIGLAPSAAVCPGDNLQVFRGSVFLGVAVVIGEESNLAVCDFQAAGEDSPRAGDIVKVGVGQ